MEHLIRLMARAQMSTAESATPFACGIANVKSGDCPEDCAFCAQSARNGARIQESGGADDDEILRRAESMSAAGFAYFGLVASGVGPTPRELDRYYNLARHIAARVDIRLCASFGLLAVDEAANLKAAGFTGYHHNLETARSHFPRVCTTHGYDARVATIRHARAAGLRVCSGGVFGLGEGWPERMELARALTELEVDSVPVNFLSPVPGTALAHRAPLAVAEALEIIARFRLALPDKDIVVCGGRPQTLGEFDRLIFSAGANGLMSGDYLTTPGRSPSRDFTLFSALGISPCRR